MLTAPGDAIHPEEVTVPKARDLVDLLRSGRLARVRLVQTRRDDEGDVVVFDIEPEVPQDRAYPIEHVERLAVTFYSDDARPPETVALRASFPRDALHLNLRPVDYPWPSLCLFEERYQDLKLRWTSAGYLQRVHEWLSLTSRGALHQAEQPPEPFILANARTLVLPHDIYEGARERRELIMSLAQADDDTVFRSHWRGEGDKDRPLHPTLLLVAEAHVHGPIQRQPRTLGELHDLLEPLGLDVLEALRERLAAWLGHDLGLNEAYLAVIVIVPRTRADGVEPERCDTWVFHIGCAVRDLGTILNLWDFAPGGARGALVGVVDTERARNVHVEIFRAVFGLSPAAAARLSGTTKPTTRVVAVGSGALGSQVVDNAVRTGWCEWTIVDDDRLLPHNLVRHRLAGPDIGVAKAEGVARAVNSIYDDGIFVHAIVADVLMSGNREALAQALAEADLILDMSASPTVGRHLAVAVEARARRASLFLNPAGTDVVLLAEDADRRVRLDDLEMQHYRAVLRRVDLGDHLQPGGQRLRYGQWT